MIIYLRKRQKRIGRSSITWINSFHLQKLKCRIWRYEQWWQRWQLSNINVDSLSWKADLFKLVLNLFSFCMTVFHRFCGNRSLTGFLFAVYYTSSARLVSNSSFSSSCLLLTVESVGLAPLMALCNGCDYTLCIFFTVPAFQLNSTLCLDKTQRAA